jgi:hypothetical protein
MGIYRDEGARAVPLVVLPDEAEGRPARLD